MKYKNQYMKDLNITSIDRLSEKVEDIFESKNLKVDDVSKIFKFNSTDDLLLDSIVESVEREIDSIKELAGDHPIINYKEKDLSKQREFSNKVIIHNKGILMPKLNEFGLEKSNFVK